MRERVSSTDFEAELLSDREWDCLCYVVERYSSKQIAQRLGVAPKTVDSYLDTARVKLGARTRQEAAQRLVDRYGLISPRKALPPGSRPGDEHLGPAFTDPALNGGEGSGRVVSSEPGSAHRVGAVPVQAGSGVSAPVSAGGGEARRTPADDQLVAARASASQPGRPGLRTGFLGNGGAEDFSANQSAGTVFSRSSDPGVELDRRHEAFATDGGRYGLGPLGTILAIGLISVLFALAAGGTLAGLASLETLLEHRVPVAHKQPHPIFSGPQP